MATGPGPALRRSASDRAAVAVTYADQTAGPRGQRMSVADRLADTARRHGPDVPNNRVRHLREPYIRAAAARVERRLSG